MIITALRQYSHLVIIMEVAPSSDHLHYRAVANGPVGPAMAGPIIEAVFRGGNFFFRPSKIIEPVILIFALFLNTERF